jgi:hypothetical protein
MKAADYPCWLSQKDLHIAQALIEKAGFIYCGKDEDFIPYDEELGTGYKLAKCYDWQLASACGEVAKGSRSRWSSIWQMFGSFAGYRL